MPADSDKDYTDNSDREKREAMARMYGVTSGRKKPDPKFAHPRTRDLDKPEEPPYGSKALKSFDVAWDDLVKFGDCPVCMGEPRACPTPELPAARCPTRRAAIRNIKGGRSTARRPNY